MTLAPSDGCRPYWTLVEKNCVADDTTRVCDPAHDRLTRTSLMIIEPGASEQRRRELAAGAQWNDDPEGLLAADPTGMKWCRAFIAARQQAKAGRVTTLLGRSQFGDLQFLHGLATKPRETNRQTYARIMIWAEFAHRVGSGDIAPSTRLRDVPVQGLAALFPGDGDRTVVELFGGDAPTRAMGTLLHLMQDVAGEGHASIAGKGSEALKRTIGFHYTSVGGVHPMHRDDAGWRALWAEDATLATWPLGARVVQQGADLLRLAALRQPWSAVRQFLDATTFSYSTLDMPAAKPSKRAP